MGNICGTNPDVPVTDGPISNRPTNATFASIYTLGEVLGEGAFSVVYLATNKVTKKQVAVKVVSKANLSEADELSLRQVRNVVLLRLFYFLFVKILQEVAILKELQHDNIVRLIGK
jgi:serine/threonine protein kinase